MWQEKDKCLVREFSFPDFKAALDFVNKVGKLAESANHHPDIQLGWGKVIVSLTTHSEGGVTQKDRDLAAEIDGILLS
jgi:4a-hydroxytetrahydrobiopterin dehydratase